MRHFLTLPCALAVLGALAAGHAAAASPLPERSLTTASTAPRALGLLVKLKDAPSHEQAAALGTTKAGTERLQGVMRTAGLAALKISPNGRAAQRVDFDHVLSAGRRLTAISASSAIRATPARHIDARTSAANPASLSWIRDGWSTRARSAHRRARADRPTSP